MRAVLKNTEEIQKYLSAEFEVLQWDGRRLSEA